MIVELPASAQRATAETPPEFSAPAPTARVLAFPQTADFFRPLGAAAPAIDEAASHITFAAQLLELVYMPAEEDPRVRAVNDKIVSSAVTRLRCALRELWQSPAPPRERPEDPAGDTRRGVVLSFLARGDQLAVERLELEGQS